MDLPSALKGPWNPLRITGTPMPASLLLLCKVIALAFLLTGHWRILPDPFLPFIPGLDELVPPEVFRNTLKTVAVLAAMAILFNRGVRASALVLGSCFLLAVVCSKAYYGNNKTCCGLCLVLAGLSDFERPPYLLRWQLSLVYFGAAVNKLLDPDWQSGLFFDYWATIRLCNPVYIFCASWLPELVAGKIACWGTIVAEFVASFGLFVPRLVPWALWINVLFQVGLLELSGNTFTLFFYAMMAATLAFVTWPEKLLILHEAGKGPRFLRFLDPDGIQEWRTTPDCPGWSLVHGGRVHRGFVAVQRLALFSPVVWLTLTALLASLESVPGMLGISPGAVPQVRRGLVAVVLLFFVPIWGVGRKCVRTVP